MDLHRLGFRFGLVAALTLQLTACEHPQPPRQGAAKSTGSRSPPSGGDSTPIFIDTSFHDLCQTVLLNGLAPAEKSVLWSRFYSQRWVRWTGQLAYVTKYQLRFRHLTSTLTYDVVLELASVTGKPLYELTSGRFYHYTGRLQRYDDGFGVLYLDQGVVSDAGPECVPGQLEPPPPLTRQPPGPPQILSQP